ncbi:hypothetical protein RB213_007266 [Colletotrichum asianum]
MEICLQCNSPYILAGDATGCRLDVLSLWTLASPITLAHPLLLELPTNERCVLTCRPETRQRSNNKALLQWAKHAWIAESLIFEHAWV